MDLNHFDPSTMTWATQMAHPNFGEHDDPFQEMLLPTDMKDHQSTYSYGFAGSEELNMHGLQVPNPTPSMKRFATAYEDPFSDIVSAFDITSHNEQPDVDAPSIDRDNKLLSFTSPHFEYPLLDYTYRQTTLSISAQLHGMFFLAESPWSAAGDAQAAPTELTCYRRNLFQITGDITLPRSLRYILTEQGDQIPIVRQELVIQATESTEGNPVKIISVPWKTPANSGAPTVDDKIEREPNSVALDLANSQDLEPNFATFPFQWKRLQFRIATANNGRRKELQQHFVVQLKVMATLATGGRVSLCEVHSGAIIVRGRSPRNFQSRKDTPLNGGGGSHARKGARSSFGEGAARHAQDGPTSAPAKADVPKTTAATQSVIDRNEGQRSVEPHKGWISAPQQLETSIQPPPRVDPVELGNNGYPHSSTPEVPRISMPAPPPPPAPISLKLVEDDTPKDARTSQTPDEQRSAKRIQIPARPPSFSLNTLNSPDESADLLYEYFPLSLSDWSEPVDAVYRPHVVHHIRTKIPADPTDPSGARQVRSKRMYVE